MQMMRFTTCTERYNLLGHRAHQKKTKLVNLKPFEEVTTNFSNSTTFPNADHSFFFSRKWFHRYVNAVRVCQNHKNEMNTHATFQSALNAMCSRGMHRIFRISSEIWPHTCFVSVCVCCCLRQKKFLRDFSVTLPSISSTATHSPVQPNHPHSNFISLLS